MSKQANSQFYRKSFWPLLLILIVALVSLSAGVIPAFAAAPNLAPSKTVLGPTLYLSAFDTEVAHLDFYSASGLNTLGYGTASANDYKSLLKIAQERGLKARVSISPYFIKASDAELKSFVSTLATYDVIRVWYLPEEPVSSTDHTAWIRMYRLVKEADPKKRPVGVYLAEGITAQYFRTWSDIADVIYCGAYQEFYGLNRAAIVTRIKAAVEGLAGTNKAVIATPQFFDLQTYMQMNGLATAPANLHIGHPTPQHARFDAYASLIVGAQGIDWYTLEYGLSLPDMKAAIIQISRELKELSPAIMSTEPVPAGLTIKQLSGPTQSADAGGRRHDTIQSMIRQYKGYTYIFIASLVPDAVTVQVSGLNDGQAEVLYENRTLTVQKGVFTDSFKDYAVHVYRIASPQSNGLTQWSDISGQEVS